MRSHTDPQPIYAAVALLACMSFATGEVHASTETLRTGGEEYVTRWLLVSNDEARIKVGAKNVANDKNRSTHTSDLVAQLLVDVLDGKLRLVSDTTSWLAKALGATKSLRYSNVLTRSLSSGDTKVVRFAGPALERLDLAAEPFVADPTLLSTTRSELAAQFSESTRGDASDFTQLREGLLATSLYSTIGYPDRVDVASGKTQMLATPVGPVRFSAILLHYENLGDVLLDRRPLGWTIVETTTTNKQGSSLEGSALLNQEVVSGLTNKDVSIVRQTTKHMYEFFIEDEPTLDFAADVLLANLQTNEKQMIDAMAYLCRVYEQSRNPRYTELMTRVEAEARSNKLRGWAKRARKLMEKNSR